MAGAGWRNRLNAGGKRRISGQPVQQAFLQHAFIAAFSFAGNHQHGFAAAPLRVEDKAGNGAVRGILIKAMQIKRGVNALLASGDVLFFAPLQFGKRIAFAGKPRKITMAGIGIRRARQRLPYRFWFCRMAGVFGGLRGRHAGRRAPLLMKGRDIGKQSAPQKDICGALFIVWSF